MLTLSEKLLLLALHDEKGSVVFSASTSLGHGLAGALFFELYFAQRIEFMDKKVRVINAEKTGNDIADEALALIASSSKLREIKYWLETILAKIKKCQQRLAQQLVEKKVLAKEEHSFLWLINYSRYPTQDAKPEQDIRAHLKAIVLNNADASEEDVALLSLVNACELIGEVFDKADCKRAKQRIEALAKDQKISAAIAQTIEELMAALLVILMAAAITTS